MTINQLLASCIDERIRKAAKTLYDEWRILRNHKKGERYVRQQLDASKPIRKPIRIQFGCGPEPKEGWLNTDLWPGPWAKPDICLDVSRNLPFISGTVSEIYTEHMFEHLDYPSVVRHFLEECFRVLAPGGTMTIGVPDLGWIFERYHKSTPSTPFPIYPNAPCIIGHPLEELNFCFHQGGEHKFLYDEQFLCALLDHFGFADVRRRAFDSLLDTEHRREGTLYVVASKP